MTRQPVTPPVEIYSERLLLRPYRPSDSPAYKQMLLENREHLFEFLPPRLMAIRSEADTLDIIKKMAAEWGRAELFIFCVYERFAERPIGEIYLANADWEAGRVEMGYFIAQDFTRQGYAREAARALIEVVFTRLPVNRIELNCHPDNLASQRVAESCGFKLEGRLRKRQRKKDGQLVDQLWYGLLRSEWESAGQ